jgi:UDP-N-acetylglucosamine 4,6-dehydratase
MISVDDARNTIELSDRYVIEPIFVEYARKALTGLGAKPVADDFSYASDTNTEWLDGAGLRALLSVG